MIFIAEKENKSNLNSLCDLLLGIVDLLSLMLIFLPLYSKPINSYIYSVNLLGYVNNNTLIIKIYWALYISLATIGIVKMLMVYFKLEKGKKMITDLSVGRMMLETINNMMLELYASMAQAELEKKEKRQREGIEAKKLRGEWDDYGRPSVMKQETFDENFQSVISGKMTPTQLRKSLGMTHSTFYRYRKTFYEKYPELSNT